MSRTMATQNERHRKPIRMLTFDGIGITGLSMLMILDDLMCAIARNEGNKKGKPLPCEVFDVIGGIGVGGWIALLLGRFHLDVPTCIRAYIDIINAVAPKTWLEKQRLQWHDASFDQCRLRSKVAEIAKRYAVGQKMLEQGHDWPRCRVAFAAAVEKHSPGPERSYQVFRTYRTGKRPLHCGPDPASCDIADAFTATSASKYLFNSCTFPASTAKLLDQDSLDPHAISLLAIDELESLDLAPCPIQVIVNISSGVACGQDVKALLGLQRKISWGSSRERLGETLGESMVRAERSSSSLSYVHRDQTVALKASEKGLKVNKLDRLTEQAIRRKREYHQQIDERLRDYSLQYHSGYPEPQYIGLGPDTAPPNTAANDVAAATSTYDATKAYLSRHEVRELYEKATPLCTIEGIEVN